MNQEFDTAAKAAQALELIKTLNFMNLATASPEAVPWNAPVFFAFDGDYFYWLSAPEAVHSQNIAHNPAVSIVIFDSTRGDWDALGVYFTAVAEAVPESDTAALQAAHEASYAKAGRTPGDPSLFTGDFPRKYYRARPTQAWVNSVEERNGVKVDIREEIDLAQLKP